MWCCWVQAGLQRLAAAAPRRWLHGSPAVLDKVLLRGLVFHGYHGVYPEVRSASRLLRI